MSDNLNSNETIGQRIKLLRIEKGMSQSELAQKCGFKSGASITRIEAGTNELKYNKALKIAEILGVDVDVITKTDYDQAKLTQEKRLLSYYNAFKPYLTAESTDSIVFTPEMISKMTVQEYQSLLKIYDHYKNLINNNI